MIKITAKEFKNIWSDFLVSKEFKKNKKNYYWESTFSLIVMALDLSPHTPDTWVECGISIKELGSHAYNFNNKINIGFYYFPKFNHCHLYFSASCLAEKVKDNPYYYFTLSNGCYNLDQVNAIFFQLEKVVFPTIKKCLTEEGFLDVYKKTNAFNFAFVHKEVHEWVSRKLPPLSAASVPVQRLSDDTGTEEQTLKPEQK